VRALVRAGLRRRFTARATRRGPGHPRAGGYPEIDV
jgi:hypothetical protein